jgi:endonuclease YncB( thermonuclease family)
MPTERAPSKSAAREARRLDLSPPYDVRDAVTFQAGDQTIRVASLAGPERHAVCLDAKEVPWACGLRARAALNNLISGRPLTCASRETNAAGEVLASCSADGLDVQRAMIASGWARPLPGSVADYQADVAAAQAARLGLWNGNWRLREPPAAAGRP